MKKLAERRGLGSGKGCGFLAAVTFLMIVGLPVLFVLSFGMSPCQDGPCNPEGASDFGVAAGVLLLLAVLIGVGCWRLIARSTSRSDAPRTDQKSREG